MTPHDHTQCERHASEHALLAIADRLATPEHQNAAIEGTRVTLDDGIHIGGVPFADVLFRLDTGVWLTDTGSGDDILIGDDPDALAELGRFFLDAAHTLHQHQLTEGDDL